MAYENDVRLFTASVAATVVAAGLLRSKQALAIPVALGLLVSNPASMKKAAEGWCDQGKEDSPENLDRIADGINNLKKQVKENKHWEGEAAETFNTAADAFLTALSDNKRYRQAAGECAGQTGDAYHAAAGFSCWVGATMLGLGAAFQGARLLPPTLRVPVQFAILQVVNKINTVVNAVVKRKMVLAAAAATIFSAVNSLQSSHRALFFGMKTLPGRAPDFTQAGLRYQQGAGITPKSA
ncbi:hypothetical protein [Streptosporangium pseudovulgare]|uniref:Uncharacterized protein n=1 Tax=Streptosporangium pseudovulgare TaxID=35765 RepID=A0ABQ2R0J8_9ACTN|nr:hypothetical protein [Streptosporangium pseudovulgare]GGQ02656.1 hypothetical protein GCM10010140_36080 [Streptosporangium pseudovulgare]